MTCFFACENCLLKPMARASETLIRKRTKGKSSKIAGDVRKSLSLSFPLVTSAGFGPNRISTTFGDAARKFLRAFSE